MASAIQKREGPRDGQTAAERVYEIVDVGIAAVRQLPRTPTQDSYLRDRMNIAAWESNIFDSLGKLRILAQIANDADAAENAK